MTFVAPPSPPQADLYDLLRGVQVRSYTPGRLRIKIPTLSESAVAQELTTRLTADGAAQTVKISALTQSALIEYDKTQYSQREFLRKLLGVLGVDEATLDFLDAVRAAQTNNVPAADEASEPKGPEPPESRQPKPSFFSQAWEFLSSGGGAVVATVLQPFVFTGTFSENTATQPSQATAPAQAEAVPSLDSHSVPGPVNAHAALRVPMLITSPEARAALEQLQWTVKSELPGRLRLHHPLICRYALIAQKVEFSLVNLDGVNDYSVSGITSNVRVEYDTKKLTREDILEVLSEAVRMVVRESDLEPDNSLRQISLASANLVFAGTASFFPVLVPAAIVTTVVVSIPTFVRALEALFVKREIKVDILDATVIGVGLGFGFVFAPALLVWIVDIGYTILDVTSKTSHQLLAKVFGKQTRKAWLLVDGQEVECKVSDLKKGDLIVVSTGEQVPVDGVVEDGDAMIDQHALTGESAPVEKTTGDSVFAMTVAVAGKIIVRVTETGENTNAAKIVRIIEHSMEHKVRLQSQAERFADLAVIPTLALGGTGLGFVGPDAMLAIINADYGTGIRVAGPTALLASLALAAKNGIIIKNANVLESLSQMDAVIFDKTGTLTQETPVVGNVICCDGASFDEEKILAYVACAEQKFSHPIAKAILQRAAELNLQLPLIDESQYHVGFGVDVQVNGDALKVGSMRYMQRENVAIPGHVTTHLENIHKEGRSAVFAAVNGELMGVIELHASSRPEAYPIIKTLREKRGIEEIYLISGDHEAATRALAERLGIPHYFAEVLPQDKAKYVQMLQGKGMKVAMVGDGINDSVALSKANYSISLRGAADIATDIADVVFVEGNLAKFDMLFQISDNLHKNVQRSFGLIVVPNTLCILGAFFGLVGLGTSLVLNNGFNTIATVNGLSLYNSVMEELETDHPGRGGM
jgi:Cu2+-exporting ATPase